jgi:hypothetical protein
VETSSRLTKAGAALLQKKALAAEMYAEGYCAITLAMKGAMEGREHLFIS